MELRTSHVIEGEASWPNGKASSSGSWTLAKIVGSSPIGVGFFTPGWFLNFFWGGGREVLLHYEKSALARAFPIPFWRGWGGVLVLGEALSSFKIQHHH